MRYGELIGKQVLDVTGQSVGHIADLVAERQGENLCVTSVRVGSRALLRRIAFRRMPLPAHKAHQIPWEYVRRIDQYVHLAISSAELQTVAATLGEE